MMAKPEPCHHCGAPSSLLCDHVLAIALPDGSEGTAEAEGWYRAGGQVVTCDRPLCERCATRAGATFYDGTTPGGGRRRGWVETTDYCREHAAGQDPGAVPVLPAARAEALRERREWQARRLEEKRRVDRWRAYRLWVAYFDQPLMGGWQAFIGDFRGRRGEHWIDRDRSWLKPLLMRAYPLLLPFGRDERERFGDWKEAFARAYRRGSQDGRPRGCAYLWWNGRDEPRPIRV